MPTLFEFLVVALLPMLGTGSTSASAVAKAPLATVPLATVVDDAFCDAHKQEAYLKPNSNFSALGRTEIVLAYCGSSIAWLADAIDELRHEGANVTAVHVVSKCGEVPPARELPAVARVEMAPNVGRNDHTYAHYLSTRYDSLPDSIFFLKDTSTETIGNFSSDARPLNIPMKDIGHTLAHRSDGFSCGTRWHASDRRDLGWSWYASKPGEPPVHYLSAWHVAVEADRFMLDYYLTGHEQNGDADNQSQPFEATYRPLGNFTRNLFSDETYADLDPVRTPVRRNCYGGTFAARKANVLRRPRSDWAALAKALTRTDNLEEGHFAERLWASLLSTPPSRPESEAIIASGRCGYYRYAPFEVVDNHTHVRIGGGLAPSSGVRVSLSKASGAMPLYPFALKPKSKRPRPFPKRKAAAELFSASFTHGFTASSYVLCGSNASNDFPPIEIAPMAGLIVECLRTGDPTSRTARTEQHEHALKLAAQREPLVLQPAALSSY